MPSRTPTHRVAERRPARSIDPNWLRRWLIWAAIPVGLYLVGKLLVWWFILHEPCPSQEPAWAEPITVADPAASILLRLSDWQAASDAERLRAAKAVAASTSEFELLDIRHFECLDKSFDIAVFLHPRTSLEFSLVPADTFAMGAPVDHPLATAQNSPAHQVTLTRPFLICRTEVTDLAWDRVTLPSGPSSIEHGTSGGLVVGISWIGASDWCIAAGLTLPTEAQWEFAARGGTRGPWYFRRPHETHVRIADMPTGYEGPRPSGAPPNGVVARSIPNAFGLHDTFDCLAEWVRDGYTTYVADETVDPDSSIHGVRMYRGSPHKVSWGTNGTELDMSIPVWDRRSPDWDALLDRRGRGFRPTRELTIVSGISSARNRPK